MLVFFMSGDLATIAGKKKSSSNCGIFMPELISYQVEKLLLSIPWIAFQSYPVNFRHKKRTTHKCLSPYFKILKYGASGRNRTGMTSRSRDFKSLASTNFATEASLTLVRRPLYSIKKNKPYPLRKLIDYHSC